MGKEFGSRGELFLGVIGKKVKLKPAEHGKWR